MAKKKKLTTNNERNFEIWEVLERVRKNPGGMLPPPLADVHARTVHFLLKQTE